MAQERNGVVEEVKGKVWTVVEILKAATGYLNARCVESPRLSAEWLLADILRCRRLDLYVNYDRPLSGSEIRCYREYLRRRADHEPLQYILGYTEFMGMELAIMPGVLIPRPDTEILVDAALRHLIENPVIGEPVRVMDVGTGSGAVILALVQALKDKSIPVEAYAMDISGYALELAGRNARRHHLDLIRFFQADVFDDTWATMYERRLHVLISNPPYISAEEFRELPAEVRQYEPNDALFGGEDGLKFYRRLAFLADRWLIPETPLSAVFFETGCRQAESVRKILIDNNFKNIEFFKDYQHIDRVVKGRR